MRVGEQMDEMIRNNIFRFSDTRQLAGGVALVLRDFSRDRLNIQPRFSLGISGGRTPHELLAHIAAAMRYDFPWERIDLFWCDERCVPPDHPESNYGMTHDTLLQQVSIPKASVHRIRGEAAPDAEAQRYAAEIRMHVPGSAILPGGSGSPPVATAAASRSWPRFDCLLLGLGEDGHTASLFPGAAALEITDKICAVAKHPVSGQKRITLTLPVLNHARKVMFLVAGRSKAQIVRRLLGHTIRGADGEIWRTTDPSENGEAPLPAARVRPAGSSLEWYLDDDAAALLD